MTRKILLPLILVLLGGAFWVSPQFQEIAAGIAIFLFGMLFLEDGFKAFTGGVLEKLLARTTDRTWKSLSFGVISTTIMQSSSLVSVITISFLSAGLLPLIAGIGIVFGANIGTTTGAWLVAGFGLKVNIAAYAMPMLAFGIVLRFTSSKYLRGVGSVLAGLGFLFLGIHYMKEGFEAFRGSFDLASMAVSGYAGLFLFAAIGALATVVMQSSHATLVLVLTALAATQITYENALAVAIGANVGTTVTAIIGALGASIEGKRLAGAHLIFNVIVGIIAIAFISQFLAAVEVISSWAGIAPHSHTLKLAVFHTLFNVVGVMVMLPFMGRLATFLTRTLRAPAPGVAEARHLNKAALDFPDTVLSSTRQEVWHLFDCAFEVIAHALNLHRNQILESEDLAAVIRSDREIIDFDIDETYTHNVKNLYAEIVEFVTASQTQMPSVFAEELYHLRLAASRVVESVKHVKHLRKNMTRFMVPENEHIRAEYNDLRLRIATVLRESYRLREEGGEPGSTAIFELDEVKATVDIEDGSLNARVTKLLSSHAINGQMATSLLNDASYTEEAIESLLDATRALLASSDVVSARAAAAVDVAEERSRGGCIIAGRGCARCIQRNEGGFERMKFRTIVVEADKLLRRKEKGKKLEKERMRKIRAQLEKKQALYEERLAQAPADADHRALEARLEVVRAQVRKMRELEEECG
ncbi:MAG: Na/Pi symporter [Halofilum sp. (in: g-proteobacteria)]|nr:Na/Pi symporter [Halofilum sp. (in: g-proteobacteria)]